MTLAELSGGRFILGLGVSNPGLNATRGHEWQAPLPMMRQYLASMAAAEIDSPVPQQPAPLYIAAHGPKLQKLGAEQTDESKGVKERGRNGMEEKDTTVVACREWHTQATDDGGCGSSIE